MQIKKPVASAAGFFGIYRMGTIDNLSAQKLTLGKCQDVYNGQMSDTSPTFVETV